jgi:NAD-dependent DNA ligase
MSELHTSVYFKTDNNKKNEQINNLFRCNDFEKFMEIAAAINPSQGKELAAQLIAIAEQPTNLSVESMDQISDFTVANFVHGILGDELAENIVNFIHHLLPESQVHAWGHGDDDPWEYWIKVENGIVQRQDDEPFQSKEDDNDIRSTIYTWWHKGMPDAIKVGFLNDGNRIDLEDEYVVFTGKMRFGSRDEMEELAAEYEANVQKSINKKTTLLVVGEKPGASKLKKAEELGIKVIDEIKFLKSVDEYEVNLEDEFIVFTGEFRLGSREEIKELTEDNAGKVQQSIDKKTTLLVVGNNPNELTVKKAKELDIKVINEKEYLYLIDEE